MPPVGDLDRVRKRVTHRLRIRGRTVPAHDLDSWMRPQPASHHLGPRPDNTSIQAPVSASPDSDPESWQQTGGGPAGRFAHDIRTCSPSRTVRRWYRSIKPGTCSRNVRRAHSVTGQRIRRIRNLTNTRRPSTGIRGDPLMEGVNHRKCARADRGTGPVEGSDWPVLKAPDVELTGSVPLFVIKLARWGYLRQRGQARRRKLSSGLAQWLCGCAWRS